MMDGPHGSKVAFGCRSGHQPVLPTSGHYQWPFVCKAQGRNESSRRKSVPSGWLTVPKRSRFRSPGCRDTIEADEHPRIIRPFNDSVWHSQSALFLLVI